MENDLILVTGASRGLGKAIATQLHNAGYSLILHASRPDRLNTLLEELGSSDKHAILCGDFGDNEGINAFCKALKTNFKGRLVAVVNNAGAVLDRPLVYQPEKEIDRLLSINLKAPIMIAKTVMKMFIRKGKGTIINMGSVVGETGNACQSVYAASKAGLVAMSKSLAQEAKQVAPGSQIRVLSVSPGFIDTDMTASIPEEIRNHYLDRIPLGRMGKAIEIADFVTFLLSEKAAYINGSNLNINGGLI